MSIQRLLFTLIVALGIQGSAAPERFPPSDFPPSDGPLLSMQRLGQQRAAVRADIAAGREDARTVERLFSSDQARQALAAAERIVSTRPDAVAAILKTVEARGWAGSDADALMAAARRQLPSLSREDAAVVARVLLQRRPAQSDSAAKTPAEARKASIEALKAFIKEYDGTLEARLAEVTIIGVSSQDRSDSGTAAFMRELDTFARQRPGTVEAAKALFWEAQALRSVSPRPGDDRGSDPTERLIKVLDLVKELESGAYPPCEFVRKAPSLVLEFFTFKPTYTAESRERSIDALTQFAATHFTIDDVSPTGNDVGYLITGKIADLYRDKGEPIAGVERTFAALERRVPDVDAVRYLRALFYMDVARKSPSGDRAAFLQKAAAELQTLANGSGALRRKALATLAMLHFERKEYAAAQPHLRRFVDAYPDSDWTWVAMLRLGQTQEAANDLEAASLSYRAVSARFPSMPMAFVLGHAYAGRVAQARGAVAEAIADFKAAFDGWDPGYETEYAVTWKEDPAALEDRGRVSQADLPQVIAQLEASNRLSGGPLIERGRSLIEKRQWTEAQAVLRQAVARHPASASTARELLHHARLMAILEKADANHPLVAETTTLANLAALAAEPYSFGVTAAKIARATILSKRHRMSEARRLMRAALEEWRRNQAVRPAASRTALETDVAAILDLVFRPKGDGVFTGGDWSLDPWPGATAPYRVVGSLVRVKLADDQAQNVASRHVPVLGGAVLLVDNPEQYALLDNILTRLGRSTDEPRPSWGLMTFWREFFAASPGHWGGWDLLTDPSIEEIVFEDAARTRASVSVWIGSEGTAVVLEKRNGTWAVLGLSGRWIT